MFIMLTGTYYLPTFLCVRTLDRRKKDELTVACNLQRGDQVPQCTVSLPIPSRTVLRTLTYFTVHRKSGIDILVSLGKAIGLPEARRADP